MPTSAPPPGPATESLRETFTERGTGNFFTASASGRFRELQPRVISTDENIVTYVTKDPGALYNVYDSDGTLLARDRGAVTERYVFDTLGDSQPGGVFLTMFVGADPAAGR